MSKFATSNRKMNIARGVDGYLHLTYKGTRISNPKVKAQVITELLIEQNNQCAICYCNLTMPHLDHDHNTNEVRGLLCRDCNIGLGCFKDNPISIGNAIRFLTGLTDLEILIPNPV